jgi:hypothetical protein
MMLFTMTFWPRESLFEILSIFLHNGRLHYTHRAMKTELWICFVILYEFTAPFSVWPILSMAAMVHSGYKLQKRIKMSLLFWLDQNLRVVVR